MKIALGLQGAQPEKCSGGKPLLKNLVIRLMTSKWLAQEQTVRLLVHNTSLNSINIANVTVCSIAMGQADPTN